MKKFFAIVMSMLMIACFMPSMAFAEQSAENDATSIDLDTFIKWLESNSYNVDGSNYTNTNAVQNGKLNVKWSPVSGCFDDRDNHTCTVDKAVPTGNTPNRVNDNYAQYQLFRGLSSDVTIKNVNFVYTPGIFKICANTEWKKEGAKTIPAELQFENVGDTTLIGCTFDKTGVSVMDIDVSHKTIIKDCTFKNVNEDCFGAEEYGDYAIHGLRNGKVYVSGNTFENVCRAMLIYSSNNTETYVVNNDFSGVANNEAMIKVAKGKNNINLVVFGNTDKNNRGTVCRMLEQITIHTGVKDKIKYTTKKDDEYQDISTADIESVTVESSGIVKSTELKVAKIGTTEYKTLEDAINDKHDGNTITLLRDVKLSSIVTISKNCTLDLNGKTITGENCRALLVKSGKLELTGEGTITSTGIDIDSSVVRVGDGTDYTKTAGTTAELIVGKNVVVDAPASYGITAFGGDTTEVVTIYGTVNATGYSKNKPYDGCAVSTNGTDAKTPATIKIEDGAKIIATKTNAIYVPSGTLDVKGGTIAGTTGIYFKSTNMTVSGGTITGNGEANAYQYYNNGGYSTGEAVTIDSCNYPGGIGAVKLTGGYFKSENAKAVGSYNSKNDTLQTKFISGGLFATKPDASYCADDLTVVASGNSKYPFTVKTIEKEEEVKVVDTAKTETKTAENVNIEVEKEEGTATEAEKEAAAAAVTTTATTVAQTESSGLEVAATTEATKITANEVKEATKALKDASISIDEDESSKVNIFVQPYLDIAIGGAKVKTTTSGSGSSTTTTGKVTELTLNIVPMVKTIASTATTANEIVTAKDAEEDSKKKQNAVEIGTAKEVVVTTPVTITIPLPTGFVSSTDDTLFIKHTKSTGASYVYTAAVSGNDNDGFEATFTNPNGFSEFVLTKDDASVAKIDGVGYTTLQAAVNAAEDGDTITVLKDGSATMSGSSRTIKFANGGGDSTNIKVTINGKEMTLNADSDAQSFTYTAPSGGRGGYVAPTTDDTKTDDTAADTKTDEQVKAENAAKAAELTKALTLKARSAKTEKGSIKVTLTADEDAIKAIEDLGYTVKYKFYRSTKKASSYKAALEKADKTYTNTTGKKGTKYYYKARVMVYDAQGELVTKTELKQCRYACRTK